MNKRRTSTADDVTAQPGAARGRGTQTNVSGRFERFTRVLLDDGWGSLDAEAPTIKTDITIDTTKSIINPVTSPDISFDRSINPYRGCEHGCSYCFARPSHAYLGLSPGLDFESKLFVKPNAAALLARELNSPLYKPKPIALGTNTDPYQPIERQHRITRQVLEVLWRFRHPVTIVTKSALVTRDIDIIGPMAEENLVKVAISVTTLDRKLARAMEPRAATPERRLDALKLLARAGVPTGVMVAPIIPSLNDHEIEEIMARAAEAGVSSAGYVVLRLPLEIRDLFREWLEAHVPDRAERVMSLVRDMRGGKDYDAKWGERMVGTGPYAALIAKRFRLAQRRLGLDRPRIELDSSKFRRPGRGRQMDLF